MTRKLVLLIALLVGVPLVLLVVTMTFGSQSYSQAETAHNGPDGWMNIQDQLYPLSLILPYAGDRWELYYVGSKQLAVRVNEDTPEIRTAVEKWIEEKGVDPASHTLEYKAPLLGHPTAIPHIKPLHEFAINHYAPDDTTVPAEYIICVAEPSPALIRKAWMTLKNPKPSSYVIAYPAYDENGQFKRQPNSEWDDTCAKLFEP